MQHYLLYKTRNGQQQWEGPFTSRRAAEGRQHMLLAPLSFVVMGRQVATMKVQAACPHAGVKHSPEWCGCTCPDD